MKEISWQLFLGTVATAVVILEVATRQPLKLRLYLVGKVLPKQLELLLPV